LGFSLQEEGLRFRLRSWRVNTGAEPSTATILFIPLCAPPHKLETDWAAPCAEVILRRCPVCERDSIIGHGRRRKQAHDEHHDWIGIRRGLCHGCGNTFTFLPLLSLPYTHYPKFVTVRRLLIIFAPRDSVRFLFSASPF
jgi:hypothetical protein